MEYDEDRCNECVWKTKCDDGHFVCFWATCHKNLGAHKRKVGGEGEEAD